MHRIPGGIADAKANLLISFSIIAMERAGLLLASSPAERSFRLETGT